MTQRTIEVDAHIEHGRVVIDMPTDVPDGPVHVVVTIDTPTQRTTGEQFLSQLRMIDLSGWPADARFGRDELYGDDGR
jgi:hypothetical protein